MHDEYEKQEADEELTEGVTERRSASKVSNALQGVSVERCMIEIYSVSRVGNLVTRVDHDHIQHINKTSLAPVAAGYV